MLDFAAILDAFSLLMSSPAAWVVVPLGLIIGLVFGAVPGLSVPIAMAVFLPMTLYMDFLNSILFLTAIFTGGGFGGSIPAILMNVPGTSASIATCFDGYPMARRGEHNRALGLALAASTVGTAIGYVLLFVILEPISGFVLRLGPPELFLIAVVGLLLIGLMAEGYFWRAVVGGSIGVLLALIGMSSAGIERGTFGSIYLLDGIDTNAAIIGIFAASELFRLVKQDYLVDAREKRHVSLREIASGFADIRHNLRTLWRGSVLGAGLGVVPGIGSSIANLVSYTIAQRVSSEPETFGKGNPNGVVAAESANSSSEGGSMVGLLALGIPSSAATAIMLSAFSMHNVTGGPRFISDQKDIVYAIIAGNLIQAVLLAMIGIFFIRLVVYIVRVPLAYLLPPIVICTALGSYALSSSMSGPITLVVFAILGVVLKRYGYSVVAVVIGLLLGLMMEGNLVRTWQLGGGGLTPIATRPISLVLLVVIIATVAMAITVMARRRSR
ncbi:tripartite tricarboxylate transporter permease [Falsirhodobacter halotolerans]|uniref:tripartite tricarboxylate transporter permease n=1 Tax=Falsirhodobacter halotolerans TaxID=1146892 RepID=UPI001FD11DE4|nr:tripartite tricarboxylate transporter permease [Falsirhodobacter halotolerans]MCJ8141026.1 tripartite tricarboxylate transporter permease [Falsirhodobacter halotolerans]